MITSVTVDTREPQGYRAIFERDYGRDVPYMARQLPTGDYWLTTDGGRLVMIERKTYADLLKSIRDGRLQAQASEMRALTDWCTVVVEGVAHEDNGALVLDAVRTGWDWDSVHGALQSVQELGVTVTYTGSNPDPQRFAGLVGKIARRSTSEIPIARREAVVLDPAELILTALPGIGSHRAEKLLSFTGGSAAWALVYLTQHDDLGSEGVHGIGPKTREGVRRALGLRGGDEIKIEDADQQIQKL